MNGMEGIFGIIGIGAGLYSLYAWFQLKFKGIINTCTKRYEYKEV